MFPSPRYPRPSPMRDSGTKSLPRAMLETPMKEKAMPCTTLAPKSMAILVEKA